jgi:hypothetical protein
VAYVARDIALGEPVSIRVSLDGRDLTSLPAQSDLALAAGDGLSAPISGEFLRTGHYRFEYLVGSETIAGGEFDITP